MIPMHAKHRPVEWGLLSAHCNKTRAKPENLTKVYSADTDPAIKGISMSHCCLSLIPEIALS